MFSIYSSKIGDILLESDGEFLTGLYFADEVNKDVILGHCPVFDKCSAQLDEYFTGKRKVFDLKLHYEDTEFRNKVWGELLKIPYGETRSYKDIAINVGNHKAMRAVGGANHNNKISIIIPCHRVIGANGALVGYGGEMWRKEWLLNLEKTSF